MRILAFALALIAPFAQSAEPDAFALGAAETLLRHDDKPNPQGFLTFILVEDRRSPRHSKIASKTQPCASCPDGTARKKVNTSSRFKATRFTTRRPRPLDNPLYQIQTH